MTITREQVADLQPGDVVEIYRPSWPSGTILRGPLIPGEGGLYVADELTQWDGDGDKRIAWMAMADATLTVVSRAPRPLYVNHPRTEPVPGDVARDDEGDHPGRVWVYGGVRGGTKWHWADYPTEHAGPLNTVRLRLLVDGETGQVVQ